MTIGYKTIGNGPQKVLFLHGWLSDFTIFDEIIPFFDGDKYTIVFMDYRGYGLSSHLTGNYSIEEIAKDVIELAKELEWEKFHAIGHSMAGMVLQKVACINKGLLISAIAVTPVPASGLSLDADTAAFFSKSAEDDSVLSNLFDALTGKQYSQTFIKHMTKRARPALSKKAMLGYFDAWTGTDFSKDVATINMKILVIAGELDGAVSPEFLSSTYLKQLKNVEMKTIGGAGHYPMQETPVRLFTLIENRLNQYA
ncbi:MAG: alpha/beta hydrolase [Robiginitomaculum sp.]|nr:alpha/beta hydrolase [Robiginitomaculum sp.]